jgi:DNA-binding NarL/FixJ family response regulator
MVIEFTMEACIIRDTIFNEALEDLQATMEKKDFPLRVAVLDDDFYALKWNTALIMRDPRTTVVTEAETPDELLDLLRKEERIHVVVVDVEYGEEFPPLDELLTSIKKRSPNAVIVCLSQYGEAEAIQSAITHGVQGYLIKSEVRMAIVPAIMKATMNGLVISPGIADSFGKSPPLGEPEIHVLPEWSPNPRLTPQIIKSFWLRVFFGMRASLAADELYLETATVERYINQAYKVLTDGWADESYLFDVDFSTLSPEDQAFVWFTLPPRK